MTIRLYNTATRQKEDFTPLDPENVRMYVCGPTVYDRAHMGNARAAVAFDVLYRLLRHEYRPEHVTYVRNITDVDDKINARAAETGRPISDITAETTQWYLDDMDALGVMRPSIKGEETDRAMPRATGWITAMVTMIEDLISKGHAYAAGGHVLFAVESYADYGKLSGRSIDDMIAGARVEVAPYKRNPMDFVLWKPSNEDQPGWDSPWGRGRPGWHIECSAMAAELLGETFDIHGGGNDLQFPHHENEVAQSKCAGHGFARYWLHNEMLQVEGKKMSKSLGNFFTVRDLLDQGVSGKFIRFVMLGTHYRKPMDWTEKKREEASKALSRWLDVPNRFGIGKSVDGAEPYPEVIDAISDDLNTPLAIAKMHQRYKELSAGDEAKLRQFLATLEFLGIDGGIPSSARTLIDRIQKHSFKTLQGADNSRIEELLKARAVAKSQKDFQKADLIRDALASAGVEIVDKPGNEFDWSFAGDFDPSKLEGLL